MSTTKGIRPPAQESRTQMVKEATRLVRRYLTLKRRIADIEKRREAKVSEINEKASTQAEPLWDELNSIGGRLWDLAGPVIAHLGGGKRTAVLSTGTIKLQRGQDSLVITDESRALKRIADLGWSGTAVQVKRSIKKKELKDLLNAGGRRRTMAGTRWVDATDMLYINGNVKVDQEVIPTIDDEAQAK